MKRFLIGLSIAMNLLVVAAVIWVVSGGSMSMVLESFMQQTHQRWVSQFEELPIQPGDIVFLGDSITEGGSWHELFPGVPVRNRGISGDVSSGVLKRLDQVTAGQPAKVFLLIGTNDLFVQRSQAEIAANVGAIIDAIASASPDTQMFVQSVLPRGSADRGRVESLNRELHEVAQIKNARWVDLYPLFLDEADGSIRNDLANDELHLLGKGYVIWRDHIAADVLR